MAVSPTYTVGRSPAVANVATGNTARDGSGTITTLLTAVAAGTKVFEVVAQPAVTTTAGMVRLFLSSDGGSTWALFDELPIPAQTVGAGAAGARVRKVYDNLVLVGTSAKLGCTTHNSESINVVALAGDLT